jgi:Ribbon-helix-helix protein, copG family
MAKPAKSDQLPETVEDDVIARLAAEAEKGIPVEKLRRRGRPLIGNEVSSTYSVRLPDDLVALTDERSELDGVSRGETIRRALIAYLTH